MAEGGGWLPPSVPPTAGGAVWGYTSFCISHLMLGHRDRKCFSFSNSRWGPYSVQPSKTFDREKKRPPGQGTGW